MKHFSLIVLGMLFFATGQIASIHIYNTTPYPAWVGVHYPRCPNDDHVIVPAQGGFVFVDTKGCSIGEIEGVLSPVRGDPSKNITLKRWKPAEPRKVYEGDQIRIIQGNTGYEIQWYNDFN